MSTNTLHPMRTIELDNGTRLQLQCTEKLFEAVRHYYNLFPSTDITDDQLRDFVINMCKNAVSEAELHDQGIKKPVHQNSSTEAKLMNGKNNLSIADLATSQKSVK